MSIVFLGAGGHLSGLLWACLLVSAAIVLTVPSSAGAVQLLALFSILRLVASAGPEFALTTLGVAIVGFKGIHLVSIMGNKGTFNKPLRQILLDAELVYHVGYLILCILGLFMHPFFFSVLVRPLISRYIGSSTVQVRTSLEKSRPRCFSL